MRLKKPPPRIDNLRRDPKTITAYGHVFRPFKNEEMICKCGLVTWVLQDNNHAADAVDMLFQNAPKWCSREWHKFLKEPKYLIDMII